MTETSPVADSASAPAPVYFRCVVLGTKLRRDACGARHARAGIEARHEGKNGVAHLIERGCGSCAIGAAHARGETPANWPDGAPVETATLVGPAPGRSRWLGNPEPAPVTSVREASAGDHEIRAERGRLADTLPRSEERPEQTDRSPHGGAQGAPRGTETAHKATREGASARAEHGGPLTMRRGETMAEAKRIAFNGKALTIPEWMCQPEVRKLGITEKAIRWRLTEGWTAEAALTTPRGKTGPKRELAGDAPKAPSSKPSKPPSAEPKSALVKSLDVVVAGSRIGGALDLIREQIAEHERQAGELKTLANQLATIGGVALPYEVHGA